VSTANPSDRLDGGSERLRGVIHIVVNAWLFNMVCCTWSTPDGPRNLRTSCSQLRSTALGPGILDLQCVLGT